MEPIPYLEPWLLASEEDGDSIDRFVRGLFGGMFWVPVEYHPELDDPFEPGPDDKIAFLLGGDLAGEFVPVYTSPEVMQMCLDQLDGPYSRARIKGSNLLIALRETKHPVVINPGTTNPMQLPVRGVQTFGTALAESRAKGLSRESRHHGK